jgi:glycosyltransferase involved in cell wall biosynthesis
MSSSPLVSIVTPSFNTGRYIGDAVASVLSQDYRNIEYFVMDGGSTDNTVDVLKKAGPRCQWVSHRDGGQSDALNKGILKSRGQILGWLNSDDTYAPGAVNAAVEYLWANPDVAAVYGDAHFTDAEGKFIAKCVHVEPFNLHRLLHYSDFIVQPAVFFRRSAFDAVGGIDTNLHWCMDYDLWLKMASKGLKFAHLPQHLANFRWLAENKTATGTWGRLREIESVVARYGEGTHGYLRLEMVNLHLQEAVKHLKRFNPFRSTASLLRATKTYVTSARAMRSTFQLRTWKIVYTGQVLRKRALAETKQAAKQAAAAKGKPPAGGARPTPGKPPASHPVPSARR